jgi:hypothetical protein
LRLDSQSIHVGIAKTAKRLALYERTVQRAFRAFESLGILTLVRLETCGSIPRVYKFNIKRVENLPKRKRNPRQMTPVEHWVSFDTGLRGVKRHRISNTTVLSSRKVVSSQEELMNMKVDTETKQ